MKKLFTFLALMLPTLVFAQWRVGVNGGADVNHFIIDKHYQTDYSYKDRWGVKELGYTDYAYSTVDGNFLTKEQAFNVNEQFSLQKKFEGLYPQDEGRLMRSFRQWVATETTQNVIFVYAYNDPWTGARPDDAVVSQNPKTEMFIDPIATHNDYFLESSLYTNETKTGIINALNKFLK